MPQEAELDKFTIWFNKPEIGLFGKSVRVLLVLLLGLVVVVGVLALLAVLLWTMIATSGLAP